MRAVIFTRYNNIGEALADQSCLKAGGFSVEFHNYFHGINDYLSLLAFGGMLLTIPEQEYAEAQLFLKEMKRHPLPADLPVRNRRFGLWGRATVFFGLGNPAIFLPIYFLKPDVLLFITIVLHVILFFMFGPVSIVAISFHTFIVLILLHAKFVALPKLRQTDLL